MTTKEIAEFFGKSSDTIARVAKKNGIVIANGKLKDFNKAETEILSRAFYKVVPAVIKTAIDNTFALPKAQPLANAELAITGKVNNQVEQLGAMVSNLAVMFQESMKMMQAQQNQITAILSKPKEIEFIQDYYTIKGYANKIKLVLTFSEALSIGRAAGKLSRDKSVEIRKADDERFGEVNSYHIDVLKEVFTV
jgi:uncharacterized protein YggU (UPF0235/DUF167 family)